MNGLDLLASSDRKAAPARHRDDVGRRAGNAAQGGAASRRSGTCTSRSSRRRCSRPFARCSGARAAADRSISARPEWVELVVPCTREAAERIQAVMAHLDADLAPDVRESIGVRVSRAADERGRMGRPARSDAHGADLLPARQADADVPHRRSRARVQHRQAAARGDRSASRAIRSRTCRCARRKGIRPGGFGLLMVRAQRRRAALQREAERSRVREIPRGWKRPLGPRAH